MTARAAAAAPPADYAAADPPTRTHVRPVMPRAAAPFRVGHACIRGFLQGPERREICLAALMESAGLPQGILHDRQAAVETTQASQLLREIIGKTNDIYLGLAREPGKPALDREIKKVAVRGRTLGAAVKDVSEFLDAVRCDDARVCVLDGDKELLMIRTRFRSAFEDIDLHYYYFHRLLMEYRWLCWLVGQRVRLNRVTFTATEPDPTVDYEGLFGCEVIFGQANDGLALPAASSDASVVRSAAEIPDYEGFADWFALPALDQSWSKQVENAILRFRAPAGDDPAIDVVARSLSVSVRTLRRRLQDEGETYQQIRTRLRRDQAIELLLTTELPICAIGAQVGYGEPSDFTRAFVNWMGCSPSEFRKRQAGN